MLYFPHIRFRYYYSSLEKYNNVKIIHKFIYEASSAKIFFLNIVRVNVNIAGQSESYSWIEVQLKKQNQHNKAESKE